MRFPIFLFLVLLLLLCSNCAKDDIIDIIGMEVLEVDDCFQLWEAELVINDDEAYKLMMENRSSEVECQSIETPEIDFTSKTLLAQTTAVVGCSAYYDRIVQANLDKKEYVYTIRINTNIQEGCTDTIFHHNWITVPKLPEDYSVRFEIEP